MVCFIKIHLPTASVECLTIKPFESVPFPQNVLLNPADGLTKCKKRSCPFLRKTPWKLLSVPAKSLTNTIHSQRKSNTKSHTILWNVWPIPPSVQGNLFPFWMKFDQSHPLCKLLFYRKLDQTTFDEFHPPLQKGWSFPSTWSPSGHTETFNQSNQPLQKVPIPITYKRKILINSIYPCRRFDQSHPLL